MTPASPRFCRALSGSASAPPPSHERLRQRAGRTDRLRPAALHAAALATLLAAIGPLAATQVPPRLRALSRQIAQSNSAANRQGLEAFAQQAQGDVRSQALFALGMAQYGARDYASAEQNLGRVAGRVGVLEDYAAYYQARSIVLAEDFERALGPLERFGQRHAKSWFRPAAERLRAESLIRLRRFDEARSLLARRPSPLEEPVRLYLAARVEHLRGNPEQAVSLYREAYYHYPFSDQAEPAERYLDGLRRQLGQRYPAAPAAWRLHRAERLYAARSYSRASAEYGRALGAGLEGSDRETAQLRRAAADYHLRRNAQAYAALAKLRPRNAALDAERLYLLCALERRQGLIPSLLQSVAKLSKLHPASPWYEEALLAVGNYYYLRDNRSEYLRWFRRLTDDFPQGKHAAYAHWKLCWRAWLDDKGDRGALLAEHIESFPQAPTTAGALYWLGRLREQEGNGAEANALFRLAAEAYPHYYYASLARERLAGSKPAPAAVPARVSRLRAALPAPRKLAREPSSATQVLLDRAALLEALGLATESARELRRADYRAPDAHFAGLELSRLQTATNAHHQALRTMKRYVFGYLRVPLEELQRDYWRYLYPLAWEARLRARAERHDLDPYLVAALIRQESEFNPGARSRAGALGLMQIMPQTGRGLFRRLGIPGFSTRKLTQPDVSLRLGTFHLKEVLARFAGKVEQALAGYNAGVRRVPGWLELGPFGEPAEFVETIPFSETRGYVQSVLRNQEMYRRLYGG